MQRFDEVRQTLQEARSKKVNQFALQNAAYALAFLEANPAAMAEALRWFGGRPEEHMALSLESDTQAYAGHIAKARELTRQAVDDGQSE